MNNTNVIALKRLIIICESVVQCTFSFPRKICLIKIYIRFEFHYLQIFYFDFKFIFFRNYQFRKDYDIKALRVNSEFVGAHNWLWAG